MALVVEQPIATFDLSEIARGDLVYGRASHMAGR